MASYSNGAGEIRPAGHVVVTATAALDIITNRVGIVVSHREVVPLTTWFADAVSTCAARGLGLQLVTSERSRITTPLEYVLDSPDARWVVQTSDGGYFDGVRGDALSWDGGAFVPSSGGAPMSSPIAPAANGSWRGGAIRVHVSVAHPAARDLELGKLAEVCWHVLTGASPAGWGVAEPASQQWSRRQITRLCRERTPAPTWLVVVGATATAPTVGVMEATRTATGVNERLRLCVSSGPTDVVGDLDVLDRLAVRLADSFNVRTMTAWLQPGRGDATRAPVFTGAPIPYGLLVGPESATVHGAPSDDIPVRSELIGPSTRRSCWVRLLSSEQPERAYENLDATLRHFGMPLPADS